MRTKRVVVIAVMLASAVAVAGCTAPRATASAHAGTVSPAAHARAPAPANPDLAAVMERFYQQIEGAHWPFAYAMLSPRYRATVSQDHFVASYDRYADLDVSLRQRGDRTVVATLRVKERNATAHARRLEETTTLAWDGEDWKIERIARRDSR